LVVTATAGNTKTREIVGPECSEVAEAIAVVMALAIDPEANLEPNTSVEPEAAEPTLEGAREEPSRAATRRPPRPLTPSSKEERALTFAVEARGEVTSAVVQNALAVLGAAFDARLCLGSRAPWWLVPSLALGLRQSLPKHMIGNSEFVW